MKQKQKKSGKGGQFTELVNSLRQCQLFAGLSEAELEAIAKFSQIKKLSKGGFLFHQGDQAEGFYVVQRGAIKIHRINAWGKEQVVHIARPGGSFGEAILATDIGYPADACAVEDSSIILIPKAEFTRLLQRQPKLSLRMVASMGQHLRNLVTLIDDLTLKDAETRLANWLVRRCPNPDSAKAVSIQLGVTKMVLAAELGTASETLSRTLAKFRAQNLVKVQGKTVTVLSPAKLNQLLRQNLGEG